MLIKESYTDLMNDAMTRGLYASLSRMPIEYEPYKHVATFRYDIPTGTTKEEFIKTIKTQEGYEIIDVKEITTNENGEEKRHFDVVFTNVLPVKVNRHYNPKTQIIEFEKIGFVYNPEEPTKKNKRAR